MLATSRLVALLLAGVLATVPLASAPAASSESPTAPRQGAPRVPTQWVVGEPFPTDWEIGDPLTAQRIFERKPPRSFRIYVGTQSYFQLKRFVWTRWGAPRVVGRGQTRICDATGCLATRRSRLILGGREDGQCGDGGGVHARTYRTYTLRNFPGYSDETFTGPPGAC